MYEFEYFDYLPIYYTYPHENCLASVGPTSLVETNFLQKNLLHDFPHQILADQNGVQAYKNVFNDKVNIDNYLNAHPNILKHDYNQQGSYPDTRVVWPNYSHLLSERLKSSAFTISYYNDNSNILDQGIRVMTERKPKYCLIVLNKWTVFNFFDKPVSLSTGPLEKINDDFINDAIEQQLSLYHNKKLLRTPSNVINHFLTPIFIKIGNAVRIAEKLKIKLVIAQSTEPYDDLQNYHKELWYIFNNYFWENSKSEYWESIDIKNYVLDWPFVKSLDGGSIVSQHNEHLVPFTVDLPNQAGHQIIADKLFDFLENQKDY